MTQQVALILACLVQLTHAGDDSNIPIVTFDGARATTHNWQENNDPVMGGRSTGTTTVKNGMLIFDGEVAIVPSLQAPGFITSLTRDLFKRFPDVSTCKGVALNLMSTTAYKGFRFSFGNAHAPGGKFFAYGYKSHFDAPVGDFGTVKIPFTNFTDYWNDGSGDPIKTCQDNKIYCPDKGTLQNMKTVQFWAEGVAGKVHLEVKEISAYGCGSSASESSSSLVV